MQASAGRIVPPSIIERRVVFSRYTMPGRSPGGADAAEPEDDLDLALVLLQGVERARRLLRLLRGRRAGLAAALVGRAAAARRHDEHGSDEDEGESAEHGSTSGVTAARRPRG